MNRKKLKKELDRLRVYPGFYSLNGEILPDRLILLEKDSVWEFFILDEKGYRRDEKEFLSEEEACEYVLNYIKSSRFSWSLPT